MRDAAGSVRRLWEAFAAHDWTAAAEQLAADLVVEWPQSAEAFVGRDNFLAMNRAHPAPNWRIESVEIMAQQGAVVAARVVVPTDESVDVCLGYYTVSDAGLLTKAVEYWTEHATKPTPDWRARWTTRVGNAAPLD